MHKDLEVVSSIVQIGSDGLGSSYTPYIQCAMSDGSIWRCDMKGENWERIKMNDFDLTKKFHEA